MKKITRATRTLSAGAIARATDHGVLRVALSDEELARVGGAGGADQKVVGINAAIPFGETGDVHVGTGH